MAGAGARQPLWQHSGPYPGPFTDPHSWRKGLIALARGIPQPLRERLGAIALDGTSGTLLLCRADGSLLDAPLALALPYHEACLEQQAAAQALAGAGPNPASTAAASASGSLARALRLLAMAPEGTWLLRHQADWLMGALLGNWRWGEATNNLRLGWLQTGNCWAGSLERQPWSRTLPEVVDCGTVLGPVDRRRGGLAEALHLRPGGQVVAGCTDASAAVSINDQRTSYSTN